MLGRSINWKPLPPLTHWLKWVHVPARWMGNCYTFYIVNLLSMSTKRVQRQTAAKGCRMVYKHGAIQTIMPSVWESACTILWYQSPDQGCTLTGVLQSSSQCCMGIGSLFPVGHRLCPFTSLNCPSYGEDTQLACCQSIRRGSIVFGIMSGDMFLQWQTSKQETMLQKQQGSRSRKFTTFPQALKQ